MENRSLVKPYQYTSDVPSVPMDVSIGELSLQSVNPLILCDPSGIVFPIIDDYYMIMVVLSKSMFLSFNDEPTE